MSRFELVGPLTLVVIQPTSFCNLNCEYCYVPGRRDPARMSPEILDAIFRTTLGSPLASTHRFEYLWHAGEPLTAGIEFFRNAMQICQKYNPGSVPVVHSIQTNGVLVDEQWLDFFKEYNFKVGVSIDGPAFLNDAKRKTWGGRGTLDRSLRGYRRLLEANLNPAVLAVLTLESLDYPDEIFEFFVDNEIWSFGFNVEEVENAHAVTSLGSTLANPPLWLRKKYAEFFSRLFDLWWPVRDFISIREIRDVTHSVQRKFKYPDYSRRPDETAELGIVTVQKNGDVTTYSPEFAGANVPEFSNFVVGNILEIERIDDILRHPIFQKLSDLIATGRSKCANDCFFFDFCGSAFVSNRYFETGRLDATESTSCILQRQIVASVVLTKLQQVSTNILPANLRL